MTVTVDIPARDWTFELNTGTEAAPVWLEVERVETWSHSPTSNDANTTNNDDGGRLSHYKSSRGDQFTLSARYAEDPATGARLPGQEAVEAWAQLVGSASKKQFRITSPGGNVKTFQATATVTQGGGGTDDPTAWQVVITASGAITSS